MLREIFMTEVQIAPGITFEELHGGKILYIKVRTVERTAIDKWYAAVEERLKTWAIDQPYLVVYDLADKNVGFTPYMRHKAASVTDLRPEVRGRGAMILTRGPVGYLLMLFARVRTGTSRQIQVFFDRSAAVKWLEEALPAHNKS
jgi:hypothetical protein